MTGYQLREWLRYRWQSTGRHGMHSPFVYRLVDDALRPALRRIPAVRYQDRSGRGLELPDTDRGLLRRIIHFTQVEEIQLAEASGRFTEATCYLRDHGAAANPDPALIPFRRLFLLQHDGQALEPEAWPAAVASIEEDLQDNDLVAVPGLFSSERHTAAWEALCQCLPQRLSIDLFRLGLLLFRDEFLVPQRFRVKFPL